MPYSDLLSVSGKNQILQLFLSCAGYLVNLLVTWLLSVHCYTFRVRVLCMPKFFGNFISLFDSV